MKTILKGNVLPPSSFADITPNPNADDYSGFNKQRVTIKNRTWIEKRFNQMQNEYWSWVPTWKEIRRFIAPTRGFFYDQIANIGTGIDFKSVLNGAPSRALRTLAAGMMSGLTSPSRPWFKLGLEDQELMEVESIKEWLEIVERTLYQIFSKSNTYGALNTIYEEYGGFGTAAAFILEDFDTVIRFRNFTVGEYYLGVDETGRVNSFARLYWMTIGQLVEEFGFENCTPQVQNNFRMGIVDRWIKVAHLIEPNDDRVPDKTDYPNKMFRSIQWEWGSPVDMALRIGGYDEFPLVCPRWDVPASMFIYGFGPGHHALGDTRMLMKIERDGLVALDKVIDPPLQMDGSVQGEANTLPGGITRTSATTPDSGVRPAYQINPNLEALQNKILTLVQAIDQTMFKDMFLMLSQSEDPQKTAYEIAKRYEEKMWVLGPVIDRTEHELLDPLIRRTFSIALKNRIIPPPPAQIQGQTIKLEYVSALAQAQKMYENTAIQQLMAFVGSIAGASPDVMDVVDVDEAVRKYAELEGIPPKIIRSAEVIQAIRDQRQQQQAHAQALQNAQALADGAKTLSDTKVGQNSALDTLLGNQNSPTAPVAPAKAA